MYSFKEMYNKSKHNLIPIGTAEIVKKWKPVLDDVLIENVFVREKISIIMEIYQSMNVPKIASFMTIKPEYPEGYMEPSEVIEFINDGLLEFIKDDINTKLKIVDEYYNTVTGKRGLLLENDIRVEDGKFLDKKHQQIVDMELGKIIDRRLELVLEPVRRLREKKLKRILKKKGY